MPVSASSDSNLAVERAMKILELISREGQMSLNDLHKVMQVGKASLLRLANTLVQCGYLEKDEAKGLYRLTLKTYEVGISAINNLDKVSIINTALVELSHATHCIAQFSVENEGRLLCLQSFGQHSPFFSVYTDVGTRAPLYSTSAGKVLLATYTNGQIAQMWDSLDVRARTRHTITDLQLFLREMDKIRRQRYALNIEEDEYGVFGVSTVVMSHVNLAIGAISVTSGRMTEDDAVSRAEILLDCSQRLSRMLGYSSYGLYSQKYLL